MENNNTNQNTEVSTQLASDQQINVVTRDPIGFCMNASNGGNNNSVIHLRSHLKFKNSTFYELINVVIEPTLLTMSGQPFKFKLSRFQIKILTSGHDKLDKEDFIQCQIRIGKIEDDGTLLITDNLPPGLDIEFCCSPCLFPLYKSLPPTIEATQPINCTNLLMLDHSVVNMFFIKWTPDQNNYALTMCLVDKPITVDILIRQLQEKGGKSSEETEEDIIRKLVDPVLVTGKPAYRFSLLCPLGKKRIEIPAKSINCDHLQCFDARIFLLMNEKKPTWKCPVCDVSCLYDEMQIQNFFLGIVTSPELDDDCTDIEFISDGSWIVNKTDDTEIVNIASDTDEEPMNLDEDKCVINELE